MTYPDIATAFAARVLAEAITENVSLTYSPDPEEMGELPTFVLAPMLPLQEDMETGDQAQVTYRWQVWVYATGASDIERVSNLMALAFVIQAAVRRDQRLADTCDFAFVEPVNDPIEIVDIANHKAALGRFELRAETDEA